MIQALLRLSRRWNCRLRALAFDGLANRARLFQPIRRTQCRWRKPRHGVFRRLLPCSENCRRARRTSGTLVVYCEAPSSPVALVTRAATPRTTPLLGRFFGCPSSDLLCYCGCLIDFKPRPLRKKWQQGASGPQFKRRDSEDRGSIFNDAVLNLAAMPGSYIELAFNLSGIGFGKRCLSRSGVPHHQPRSAVNCIILQEVFAYHN